MEAQAFLLSCILTFVVEEYIEFDLWALCPLSTSCVCRKNITVVTDRPRCITLTQVARHCPLVRFLYFFNNQKMTTVDVEKITQNIFFVCRKIKKLHKKAVNSSP